MKSFLQTLCILLCLSLSTTLVSQDTETRNLGSFEGISVSSGVNATLVRGNSNEIEITASGIELDKVTSDISRDILKVGIDQNWWNNLSKRNKRKVNVTITYNSTLNYISSSSGAHVESENTILANELELNSSSGANLELDLEANKAEIGLSSGATMHLSGNAKFVDIDLSSGSSLKAYDLEAENITVDGSSGSSAKVHASKSINADVSSGASVLYKGDPSSRDIDKSSGGSVNKA